MGDIMERFWKKWLNADTLKRHNIIERMVKQKGFDELLKIEAKNKNVRVFATVLNGYFEDLAYMAGHLIMVEKDKEIAKLKKEMEKERKFITKIKELAYNG